MKNLGAAILAVICLQYADSAAVFDRNFTKPYVLKKTWVQNFIKFQYIFEGNQGKAKIVPLGKSNVIKTQVFGVQKFLFQSCY